MAGDPEYKGSREQWMTDNGFERHVIDQIGKYVLVRRGDQWTFSVEDSTSVREHGVVGAFGPSYDGTGRFRVWGRPALNHQDFVDPLKAFAWWVEQHS